MGIRKCGTCLFLSLRVSASSAMAIRPLSDSDGVLGESCLASYVGESCEQLAAGRYKVSGDLPSNGSQQQRTVDHQGPTVGKKAELDIVGAHFASNPLTRTANMPYGPRDRNVAKGKENVKERQDGQKDRDKGRHAYPKRHLLQELLRTATPYHCSGTRLWGGREPRLSTASADPVLHAPSFS